VSRVLEGVLGVFTFILFCAIAASHNGVSSSGGVSSVVEAPAPIFRVYDCRGDVELIELEVADFEVRVKRRGLAEEGSHWVSKEWLSTECGGPEFRELYEWEVFGL
jgi:hypothetical protein